MNRVVVRPVTRPTPRLRGRDEPFRRQPLRLLTAVQVFQGKWVWMCALLLAFPPGFSM